MKVSEWHKAAHKKSFRLKTAKFSFVNLDSIPAISSIEY